MKFTTLAHITTAASIYMVSSIVVAHTHHHGGITTQPSKVVKASFDIVHSKISTEGNVAIFHMAVSGKAGDSKPAKSGKLAGVRYFPTSGLQHLTLLQ